LTQHVFDPKVIDNVSLDKILGFYLHFIDRTHRWAKHFSYWV
jgi:hypothetical protein